MAISNFGKIQKQQQDLANRQLGIAQQQERASDDFRKNISGNIQSRFNLKADTAKLDREAQSGQARKSFNQRGLLFSGLERGAQSDLQGALAGRLAQGRQESNIEAEQQAQGLEDTALKARNNFAQSQNAAIQTGMAEQEANAKEADLQYQKDMDARERRMAPYKAITGLLGGIGGKAAG